MKKNIEIEIAKSFDREYKRLIKKYKSLKTEITDLINKMQVDPFQGADLGGGVRKIRLPIESKGKGQKGRRKSDNTHRHSAATDVGQSNYAVYLRQVGAFHHQ